MAFFGLLPFRKKKTRGYWADPTDDRNFSPSIFAGPVTSGIAVNPETAMRFTAVYAAVKVISETVAAVPIAVYTRQDDGGKIRAQNHGLYRLLKTRPNKFMTSFEFREMMTAHCLLRGNGYAQIIRNNAGDPTELWILHPTRVTPAVDRQTGEFIYRFRPRGTLSREIILPKSDVLHLKDLSDDGLAGRSRVELALEAVGLGLAAEAFAAAFFGNGAAPSGVLETKDGADLDKTQIEAIKKEWEKVYQGARNASKVAVLDNLQYKPISIPPKDSQLNDLRLMQMQEIARVFRLAPHLLGDLTRGSFSSIEQMSLEFLQYTMLPWFRRWEEAISRDLIPDAEQETIFAEFIVDGILRGDLASRQTAYSVAHMGGWMSVNEIRAKENLNPIGPEGDVYLAPLNMVNAADFEETSKALSQKGKAPAPQEGEPPGIGNAPKDGDAAKGQDKVQQQKPKRAASPVEVFRPIFSDAWGRIVRKEVNAVSRRVQDGKEITSWLVGFRRDCRDFAGECLRNPAASFGALIGRTIDLEKLLDEYAESISVSAERCAKTEDELCQCWVERTIGYGGEDVGIAA